MFKARATHGQFERLGWKMRRDPFHEFLDPEQAHRLDGRGRRKCFAPPRGLGNRGEASPARSDYPLFLYIFFNVDLGIGNSEFSAT